MRLDLALVALLTALALGLATALLAILDDVDLPSTLVTVALTTALVGFGMAPLVSAPLHYGEDEPS